MIKIETPSVGNYAITGLSPNDLGLIFWALRREAASGSLQEAKDCGGLADKLNEALNDYTPRETRDE